MLRWQRALAAPWGQDLQALPRASTRSASSWMPSRTLKGNLRRRRASSRGAMSAFRLAVSAPRHCRPYSSPSFPPLPRCVASGADRKEPWAAQRRGAGGGSGRACLLLACHAVPQRRSRCCAVCLRVPVLFSVERDMLEEESGELAINDDEPCPEPIMLSVSHFASAAF